MRRRFPDVFCRGVARPAHPKQLGAFLEREDLLEYVLAAVLRHFRCIRWFLRPRLSGFSAWVVPPMPVVFRPAIPVPEGSFAASVLKVRGRLCLVTLVPRTASAWPIPSAAGLAPGSVRFPGVVAGRSLGPFGGQDREAQWVGIVPGGTAAALSCGLPVYCRPTRVRRRARANDAGAPRRMPEIPRAWSY